MTTGEKQRVALLRSEGWGYKKIAADLNLSENAIKKYCQRHNLGGKRGSHLSVSDVPLNTCLQCGKAISVPKTGRHPKFCSDVCRMVWWRNHPDKVIRKAFYTFNCLNCGRSFTAYGDAHRKYCSRDCYINDRFHRETDDVNDQRTISQ